MADTTAQAVTKFGLSTVGLLGTAFTMEQDFYRDRLASHGLTVLTPPAAERAQVHRIIYDELCLGKVQDESRQIYRNIITGLAEAGAERVRVVSICALALNGICQGLIAPVSTSAGQRGFAVPVG